jgi:hypothetical protein
VRRGRHRDIQNTLWFGGAHVSLKTAHNKKAHEHLFHFISPQHRVTSFGQGSNLRRHPVPEGMCNYLLNDCEAMRRREGRRDTGGVRGVSIDRSWFIFFERRLLFYRHDARHISNPSAYSKSCHRGGAAWPPRGLAAAAAAAPSPQAGFASRSIFEIG